jgi:hypothetical protein
MAKKLKIMKNSVSKISEKTLKIQNFLETLDKGKIISYEELSFKTGVPMDKKGKTYLRSALSRAKIEYSVVHGEGIELASPTNTIRFVGNRLIKVDKAVKRAEKTQKNLINDFFNNLPPEEQKQILYIGAVFGAIRVASDNGKMIYSSKNKVKNCSLEIPLPKFD